jgi:hypothetical protein
MLVAAAEGSHSYDSGWRAGSGIRSTRAPIRRGCWKPLTHFIEQQLTRATAALAYLRQRGIRAPWVIRQMRIGYAPGACLRSSPAPGWLSFL